ncbi:hypothetical protein PR202_gb04298 [Eleusine coracana subsp. coracana]|uniref:NADPH oxidase Respiratory burst domain-containing protein n=1 Tax=Eleusine coracana subsp. coracana TaxID=191504 RepID=A0AAV5E462_ELECO|nr:hypothetical protein PR202_gb04298 [Eleusine coracana subsp. coracana]
MKKEIWPPTASFTGLPDSRRRRASWPFSGDVAFRAVVDAKAAPAMDTGHVARRLNANACPRLLSSTTSACTKLDSQPGCGVQLPATEGAAMLAVSECREQWSRRSPLLITRRQGGACFAKSCPDKISDHDCLSEKLDRREEKGSLIPVHKQQHSCAHKARNVFSLEDRTNTHGKSLQVGPAAVVQVSPPAASGIAFPGRERGMAGYGDQRPSLDGITVDGGGRAQHPGAGMGRPPPGPGFARGLMKQPSRLASGVRQFASRVSMKVPEGMGMPGMRVGKMTRMQSSAQIGLRGLRFLDKTSGGKEGWKAVERRFDDMNKGGRLPKESFGKCIGEDSCFLSIEFAILFDMRYLVP